MSWVEIISAVLGLSCVFLAGRGSKYNFWVGYVYNIFLFILFWRQHLYSAMLIQPVAFAINAWGHWRWTHPKEEEKNSPAGFLHPDAHPERPVPERPQMLGVLDCVAGGKCRQHSALHQLRLVRYAYCQRFVSCQRHLVPHLMAP